MTTKDSAKCGAYGVTFRTHGYVSEVYCVRPKDHPGKHAAVPYGVMTRWSGDVSKAPPITITLNDGTFDNSAVNAQLNQMVPDLSESLGDIFGDYNDIFDGSYLKKTPEERLKATRERLAKTRKRMEQRQRELGRQGPLGDDEGQVVSPSDPRRRVKPPRPPKKTAWQKFVSFFKGD